MEGRQWVRREAQVVLVARAPLERLVGRLLAVRILFDGL
jgi:hypothetical protein